MKLLPIALIVVASASLDHTITRRCAVTFDGKDSVVAEGAEIDVPCTHAAGKTHKLKVAQAKTYEFKGEGMRFDFDSSMHVAIEAEKTVTQVKVEHATGSFVMIQIFSDELDESVLAGGEAALREEYGAREIKPGKSSPASRTIGADKLAGTGLLVPIAGTHFSHELFWKNSDKKGFIFQFFKNTETAETAEKLFGTITSTFKFEPAGK